MLLVKHSFRNLGKVYTAGSVITEPAGIKRFKGKLAEGKIIEVTEQTYKSTAHYFKVKFGVDIPPLNEPTEELIESTEQVPSVATDEVVLKEEKKVVKTKVVSK